MANTTNYNWETPDDTDLVKDGAAAIRTLGSSIDTTTKNLNPETTTGDIAYRSATANTNTRLAIGSTGQVLTVAAGVPSWATPTAGDIEGVTAGTGISGGGTSGTVTVTNSMATAIDAKGDLIAGTGADTFARLAVGTNGHTLVADSAEATGLKWAAPASGGGMTLLSTTSLTGTTTTVSSIDQTYTHLYLVINNAYGQFDATTLISFNGDTTSGNYSGSAIRNYPTSTTNLNFENRSITGSGIDNVAQANQINATIYNYTATTFHTVEYAYAITTDVPGFGSGFGVLGHNGTSAITSIGITIGGTNTWQAGTVKIYGVK
jgi:hypothetical protein